MLEHFTPGKAKRAPSKVSGRGQSGGAKDYRVVVGLLVGVALLLGNVPARALPHPQLLGKNKKKISRTVTGQVLDGADNPIVGAAVELTDTTAGKKIAIYSEEEGRYQFADLNANHDYQLQALHNNLSSTVRKVSSFDDRDKIVVILRIPPPKE